MTTEELEKIYMNRMSRVAKQSEFIDKIQKMLEVLLEEENPDPTKIESLAKAIQALAASCHDINNGTT